MASVQMYHIFVGKVRNGQQREAPLPEDSFICKAIVLLSFY